jgi:Xaa-Pro aminopeptidase
MPDRRQLLGAALGGAAACGARGTRGASEDAPAAPADVGFLATEPLLNIDRARFFMQRDGVDAVVVTDPANVFYATNHWPSLDRMGFRHSTFAILPRDPKRPLTLIMQGFLLYYRYADEVSLPGRVVYPYSEPATAGIAAPGGIESEPLANPIRMHRVVDEALLTPREQRRRGIAASAQPPSAGADWALLKAMRSLSLDGRRIAADDSVVEATLGRRGFEARFTDAEDLLRWTRLEKTPAEIRLMRIAARQNVEAAMTAARQARAAGSTRALRARFFEAAGRLGSRPVFLVVNGSSSERFDEPIRDGMAFSIDAVSTFMQYHGDFARTIFVGEPREPMRRCTAAIHKAWDEIRSRLRPGMAFSEVQRIGRESMRSQGADFTVGFGPHSVGLYHSDHPSPSLTTGRSLAGLTLVENMVLSVDCPVLDTGIGGTAHLEDLVLIGRDGATPLHDVPANVVVV